MKDSFQKVLPNLGKSSDMTNIHKEITIDNRIFLKGFKLETREEEVENIFKAYGDIVETKIIRDSFNGQSRGFGFVTFDSQQVAQEVLNKVQSLQIGDTEITVGPAKIRRLPPFGKPFRNRYPNDVQPSNFIPPHPQNQSHQPHYYSMPAYIVSPDGMFTWLPNNAAAPYQKFPYYPDASGGYYQQDNAANEHQSIINSDASNNSNNKINSIYDANKIDGTSSEIFVNSQSSPSTNGGGKYDLPSPNSSTSGSSPVTHKPPPAAVDQFKLSSSSGGGAPVFNPPPTTLQPTFVPVSSPQNGGGSSGELIHMNGSYIHPNGTFIPTTSHVTMFNNNSYLQHVSNNMNNNSSTINSSEMKHHQHHHHQQHPNFFYNGMVTCADRNIPAVSMGYPPVSCSASDMALLAAGFNNMMTVQPSYQYIPMAGPSNMPFIPVTTATSGMEFNNNNKPVNENHDAVSFTPISLPQPPSMMHHNNAQPPTTSFQPTKMPLTTVKSNVVESTPVGQPQNQKQQHAVETNSVSSSVGLKAQNFVFMSTAPGKVNRVVVH